MKVVLLIILLFVANFSMAQTCNCPNDTKRFLFKKRVVICGTLDKRRVDSLYILSEMTAKDCLNNKYLLDSRVDATETFSINSNSDSVTITTLQLIPDSSMIKLTFVPLSYKTIKLTSNGKPKLSQSRFVFTGPKLTEYQKKYVSELCVKLKSGIKKPISIYPSDETSIYALFLGALTNCNDCYDLFVNLDKYYELDGAIAETKSEIPFEYIIENISKFNRK